MRLLLVAGFFTWTLAAQNSPIYFEAAEIRINGSAGGDSRGDIQNGRLYVRNVPLRFLIAEAWSITREEVIGPPWLDDIRVDVVAKASSPTTPDSDVREMLQSLLKERMHLVEHQEQQERPAWALTVWKGRNKMKPSSMPAKPEDASCSLSHDKSGTHFACEHLTMALLALKLPHVAASQARDYY
jgi:uncharacterized protein (TIGR03435 family)